MAADTADGGEALPRAVPALDDKLQNTILVGLEGQVQLEVPEIARKGTCGTRKRSKLAYQYACEYRGTQTLSDNTTALRARAPHRA